MSIDEASRLDLPNEHTLVYVDASHDFESVMRDIGHYIGFSENGGVICGDDWPWSSVSGGVKEYAKQYDKQIEVFHERVWTLSGG